MFKDISASGEQGLEVINLVQGAPGVRHLKIASDIMTRSTEYQFKQPYAGDGSILQYGPRLGSTHARESVAKFLSEGYGDTVKGDNLVITGGATNGMAMVCTHFFKNSDFVFVEDPTYFIAICMLKGDLKMNVLSAPTDEAGLMVEEFERAMEKQFGSNPEPLSGDHPFRAMLYLIPTYNNPRGHCMPPERCERLIKVARKFDILIFCDDVYNLLHFDAGSRAPPRLLTYDHTTDADYKGNVISNGTFSKILAPGLRLGWVEAGDRIVDSLRKSNILWSAGCTNHYASEMIATAIDLGLQQEHVAMLNMEYKSKVRNIANWLRANLPEGVTFNEIVGGYFLWLAMPEKAKGAEVAKLALEKYKVRVMPGQNCSLGGNFQNCLRVSISYQDEDVCVEGCKRLAAAIREHLATL